MEPVFESQTKTKLGSTEMETKIAFGSRLYQWFFGTQLDNFLHKNTKQQRPFYKILQAEKERKELSGIIITKERAKKPAYTIKN